MYKQVRPVASLIVIIVLSLIVACQSATSQEAPATAPASVTVAPITDAPTHTPTATAQPEETATPEPTATVPAPTEEPTEAAKICRIELIPGGQSVIYDLSLEDLINLPGPSEEKFENFTLVRKDPTGDFFNTSGLRFVENEGWKMVNDKWDLAASEWQEANVLVVVRGLQEEESGNSYGQVADMALEACGMSWEVSGDDGAEKIASVQLAMPPAEPTERPTSTAIMPGHQIVVVAGAELPESAGFINNDWYTPQNKWGLPTTLGLFYGGQWNVRSLRFRTEAGRAIEFKEADEGWTPVLVERDERYPVFILSAQGQQSDAEAAFAQWALENKWLRTTEGVWLPPQ